MMGKSKPIQNQFIIMQNSEQANSSCDKAKIINNNNPKIQQMPDLALKCAQFFHALSQYCLSYYKNYDKDEKAKKTKAIKKANNANNKARKNKKNSASPGNTLNNQQMRPQPPKKPLTAYIIYFQQKKPSFVEKYQSLNLSQLTKLIAKQWKQLPVQLKKIYLDKASVDRKRYDEELTQYKKNHGQVQNIQEINIEEQPNIDHHELEFEPMNNQRQEEGEEQNRINQEQCSHH